MYNPSRLIIGTAQFGLNYGIAGAEKNTLAEIKKIVASARSLGIDSFDTAKSYGTAEEVLGQVGVKNSTIITKLPTLSTCVNDIAGFVKKQIIESLELLGVDSISGLLIHDPKDLLGENGDVLFRILLDLKDSGIVKQIGVSVYETGELDFLSDRYNFDLVQVPFNIFDDRFIESGVLSKLRSQGAEIHARSIFLQGLLLMDKNSIPSKFDPWTHLFRELDESCAALKLSRLACCLAYAFESSYIDNIIVGVNSLDQFNQILASIPDKDQRAPKSISGNGYLIRPDKWGKMM
jgi:aryl-alcohol dehydrogenase-like predicted oxidoreductase